MNFKFSIITLVFTIVFFQGYSQNFYFNNKETTLVKSINQSPAHWYIEIFSNSSIDQTLRWKSIFIQIPVEWSISFDNQFEYYPVIHDQDSADFTLFANPALPQKLIIGAKLNNTPGNGTVAFEIYDPLDLNFKDTIEFHFIISDPLAVPIINDTEIYTYDNGLLKISNSKDASLTVYDEMGRLVAMKDNFQVFDLKNLLQNNTYFFELKQEKTVYFFKLRKE